jgi:hypothetical protein
LKLVGESVSYDFHLFAFSLAFLLSFHTTQQLRILVTSWTYIQEMLGSAVGGNTGNGV